MLLDDVRQTIKEKELLDVGDSVICAVSGGADSICLLYVLLELKNELKLNLFVANVNHLIRGEEAVDDSNFVKKLCEEKDIPFFYREYDVPKISKEMKLGEEECGRVLRYKFFEELSKKLKECKIATAHNLNDNAETILFRLVRGSSALGLQGIRYKRGNIIRPLLDISRNEIEKYLVNKGISWREDSTNSVSLYTRNKIRLEVLPILREISSATELKIVDASKYISEDNAFLEKITDEKIEEIFKNEYLIVENVESIPIPIMRRISNRVLKRWGCNEADGDKTERFIEFLSKENGKKFDINGDFYAQKSYDRVYLRKKEEKKDLYFKILPNTTLEQNSWIITIKVVDKLIKKTSNNIAIFDFEKLDSELVVRYRKDGDRIIQKGLNGTKKISDILTDEKIDREKRDIIPIVECRGEILFLCGLRSSAAYLPDKNTKKFLVIEYLTKE